MEKNNLREENVERSGEIKILNQSFLKISFSINVQTLFSNSYVFPATCGNGVAKIQIQRTGTSAKLQSMGFQSINVPGGILFIKPKPDLVITPPPILVRPPRLNPITPPAITVQPPQLPPITPPPIWVRPAPLPPITPPPICVRPSPLPPIQPPTIIVQPPRPSPIQPAPITIRQPAQAPINPPPIVVRPHAPATIQPPTISFRTSVISRGSSGCEGSGAGDNSYGGEVGRIPPCPSNPCSQY
ncbi:protein enabled homolog [Leptidea sinapis]|uniref:protein enabled homolog n=1 Tax=Leptidea sinapis TaxID=189913 RepID=UPI0021C303DB|nr:protein enabled homolog [Leptidea sinapis]